MYYAALAPQRFDRYFYTIETMEGAHEEESLYGSLMMERLTGNEDGHIDHVLQVIVSNFVEYRIFVYCAGLAR